MNQVMYEKRFPGGQAFQLVHGDLTHETVDAIVNAANEHLMHGGGVAGLIASRGGAVIQQESNEWVRQYGPVSHQEPAYTSAGNLPCRYVIHAVGPVWGDGDEDQKLTDAVRGALRLADHLNLKSVSLPAISTGIFGFPRDRAANVICEAIQGYFHDNSGSGLQRVRLVIYDRESIQAFLNAWEPDEGAGQRATGG